MGEERAGREAMSILMMEAVAARGRLLSLPGLELWVGGEPLKARWLVGGGTPGYGSAAHTQVEWEVRTILDPNACWGHF